MLQHLQIGYEITSAHIGICDLVLLCFFLFWGDIFSPDFFRGFARLCELASYKLLDFVSWSVSFFLHSNFAATSAKQL